MSLRELTGSQALTAGDKYALLDARDKIIRQGMPLSTSYCTLIYLTGILYLATRVML